MKFIKDLKDSYCYIYISFNTDIIMVISSDANINKYFAILLMKQKGKNYKIGYDCYKRLKQNKLLSLIMQKIIRIDDLGNSHFR